MMPEAVHVVACTHQPPTICQRPSAMRCAISANIRGSFCSIHSYIAAELDVNRKSPVSFIRSSAERKVALAS
jgi:hypothetical protein